MGTSLVYLVRTCRGNDTTGGGANDAEEDDDVDEPVDGNDGMSLVGC
jgi:hypothetical protein